MSTPGLLLNVNTTCLRPVFSEIDSALATEIDNILGQSNGIIDKGYL